MWQQHGTIVIRDRTSSQTCGRDWRRRRVARRQRPVTLERLHRSRNCSSSPPLSVYRSEMSVTVLRVLTDYARSETRQFAVESSTCWDVFIVALESSTRGIWKTCDFFSQTCGDISKTLKDGPKDMTRRFVSCHVAPSEANKIMILHIFLTACRYRNSTSEATNHLSLHLSLSCAVNCYMRTMNNAHVNLYTRYWCSVRFCNLHCKLVHLHGLCIFCGYCYTAYVMCQRPTAIYHK